MGGVAIIVHLSVGLLLVTLVTGLAVTLLLLLHKVESGLEVGVHIDNVLSVVVAARVASGGAEAEDDESLRLEDGIDAIPVVVVALTGTVLLDHLAFFELDGVSGEVYLDLAVVSVLKATDGGGSTNELGVVGGLAGGGGGFGGEGVGGGGADRGEEGCEQELHGLVLRVENGYEATVAVIKKMRFMKLDAAMDEVGVATVVLWFIGSWLACLLFCSTLGGTSCTHMICHS